MSELEKSQARSKSETLSVLLGAAFLMATSAIGPGFLTQTVSFTNELKTVFAFAILLSILIDIVVQLNIWRVLAVSGLRGQDVANKVLPGLGYFLAFAVALGGLAFNVGNVGGAALGFQVLFGADQMVGAVISAAIAITIFLWKDLGKAMDKFTQILGFLMLALVFYVVFVTKPPVMETVHEMIRPLTSLDILKEYKWLVVLTLVGGTVGGYISFSGAHRIIDAGIVGKENISQISKGSINGIAITGVMRYLLFLAFLGVVLTGTPHRHEQPCRLRFPDRRRSSWFPHRGSRPLGGGHYLGRRRFLYVGLLSCGRSSRLSTTTTVTGSSRSSSLPTSILTTVGRPVALLIVAGSLNGLILPLSLGCVLMAAHNKNIVKDYMHPVWMTALGWVIVVFTAWMGFNSFAGIMKLFQ